MATCKVNFKLNSKVTLQAEGDSVRDVFEELAKFAEVFGDVVAVKKDWQNGKEIHDVIPVVRVDDDDNKYYELKSPSTGIKKAFGCHKKGGGLFPKRKDKDDNWLPDNGWVRWDREKEKEV